MSDVTINDLPQANTIDAIADWLPIWTDNISETQKINRNTLLGILGNPVGTTDSQTLTTKVLGNTNTVTLKDTLFTLQDDSDSTKQAKFQLSGLTTATTRTYTLPDASTTIVGTGATQTLTNKTLTSPVITGGTYDNGTITVDSIAGHSTSTIVTVGGVQMNNGTIGTSSAVVTASIADGAATPAKLQSGTGAGWAWGSHTPTLTNLAIGTGGSVNQGYYIQTGKTVNAELLIKLGSAGESVSGLITFSLPVTASSHYNFAAGALYVIGTAEIVAAGNFYFGFVILNTTTTAVIQAINCSGTYATPTNTSSSVPDTWTAADILAIDYSYEVA